MATQGNYALRLPSSLMDDLRIAAERDGVSMNGFIVQALAEKIAALRARGLLHELTPEEQSAVFETWAARAARGRSVDIKALLAKAGTTNEVLPGDDLPEGWPDTPIPDQRR